MSSISFSRIIIIMFISVLSFSALYATQPLQPLFVTEFGVSKEQSAMLTTVTMIPLAVAPILYGYFLESFSSKTLLRFSVGSLALLQLGIFFADSFQMILVLRVFVGIVLPAILTSLMTYISVSTDKNLIQKFMGLYISSTIMGGFAGRFFSGLIASTLNWRYSFMILAVSLGFSVFLTGMLREENINLSKFKLDAVMEVLRKKRFLGVYFMIFSTFFMFAAVLNFIPFRILELDNSSSVFRIGLMYTGYIMGLAVSVNSLKIIKFFGGEIKTITIGLLIYALSLTLFASTSIYVLFAGMFVFCGSMFLAHSVASGYLNKLAEGRKGITNGLYVAFYYSGGSLGSVLPGYIYSGYGWGLFLVSLAILILSTLAVSLLIIRS